MSELKLYYARAQNNTMDNYRLDLLVRADSPEAVMTALIHYYEILASHIEDGVVEVCEVPDGPGAVDWGKMYDSGVMVGAWGGSEYNDNDDSVEDEVNEALVFLAAKKAKIFAGLAAIETTKQEMIDDLVSKVTPPTGTSEGPTS